MNIYWDYKFTLIYSENLEYGFDSPQIKKELDIYIKKTFYMNCLTSCRVT